MHWIQDNQILQYVNYGLFGLHLIAGLVLLIFAWIRRERNFQIQLFWREKPVEFSARWLVWMAVAFLLITAGFHLWYAWNTHGWYGQHSRQGTMSVRWYEYGITATIMAIIVAIISGVNNVLLVVTIAALAVGIMSTGLWFETIFGQSMPFIPLIVGFLLLAAIYVAVFVSYRDRVNEANADPETEEIPSWITWLVIGTLAFYGVFGIVPVVRWLTNWDPIYFEYAYLALSATAKLYLGAFLGYGVLQRAAAESA